MCGIVGAVGHFPVNQDLYDALTILQHRGQDAAGIVTCDHNRLFLRKGNGLVRDVFRTRHMFQLQGNLGIGHVRYPTAGGAAAAEAQPFYVNSPYGIMLAHNGNLTNTAQLRHELMTLDRRHLNTHSDSEVLLNVFAHALYELSAAVLPDEYLKPEDIFKAVARVHERCKGAYAVVALIAGHGLVAFRDPYGIRPAVYGKRDTANGPEYMVASENIALDILGYKVINDIQPGEAIYITQDGVLHQKQCAPSVSHSPCLFEYIYLARPDSTIDKISVYKVRLRMGEQLAEKIKREWPHHDIDVVMPIPETSGPAATTLARQLGVKFREGFVKNRYIGRTFIMPGQSERRKSVRQKLNTIALEFRGKNVLLVDDSIVRGTTAREIVQMARDAGALKVYFASAAPAIRYPNVYGIDMPAATELVAYNRTVEEVGQVIGADKVIYQDLNVVVEAAREGNSTITHFEDSVFTGSYVTGDIDEQYLENLALCRNDQQKALALSDTSLDMLD